MVTHTTLIPLQQGAIENELQPYMTASIRPEDNQKDTENNLA
jgi:hypothetical protein